MTAPGVDPGESYSERLRFLAQRLVCLRKNCGYLHEYERVVLEVKISDPDSPERYYAARPFRHPHHSNVEKRWGKYTSTTYPNINWKVVRNGGTHFRTMYENTGRILG